MAAFNWQEFLATFGGQTALLAAVAYLIKTLVSSRLEKDAEAFKADLKRNSEIEIERLKNALQMTALEHQVRFSKLHEQRVEIIGKLSVLIQNVPILVQRLVRHPSDVNLSIPAGEKRPSCMHAFTKTRSFFQTISFSDSTYSPKNFS